jgi:hypothetical protein
MATALKTRTAQRAKGEESVFPRKDDNRKPIGKWLAKVTLKGPDGKKILRTRTADSEDAAVIAKAELLAEYPDGLYVPPVPDGESAPNTIGAPWTNGRRTTWALEDRRQTTTDHKSRFT